MTPPPLTYRPMREGDLLAVHEGNVRAFEDLDRRLGTEYPSPPPNLSSALGRLRRLLETDPGGAWVAERGGEVAGCALALLREGLWGLSLLFVDPPVQGTGAGRELLARAWAYGEGARGHVILSSTDPRAMRAYARLGLEVHPCLAATGSPAIGPAGEVRRGGADDLPLTEAVDRTVRGAAHGEDLLTMLAGGNTLLVAPGRGYAVVSGGRVRCCAAFDDDGARTVLRGTLAHVAAAGLDAHVEWLSARQGWAVEVCLDARLGLTADAGCVFTGGDVGPFRPYLPSGAYL